MGQASKVFRLLAILCAAGATFLVGNTSLRAWGIGAGDTDGVDGVARGKYLFAAASCGECHTEHGTALASGGRRFDGPFGTVYSTNITPDQPTGIGGWTDRQIIAAIRMGRRPNGAPLIPVHPYPSFSGMADDDVAALVAYLRTVPPVSRPNRPKLTMPLFDRVLLPAWIAAFGPRGAPPASAPAAGVARGGYLVRAVSHCGECHTPRTITMTMDDTRFLAGNPSGLIEGAKVPNITPDKESGIGIWTVEQIADFLASGNKPDGDVTGGLMGQLIEGTSGGYKDLTEADRRAIAQYLKSIPPIRNTIPK